MFQKQKKYSYYIVALLSALIIQLKSFSQNNGIEKVFVHINKNVFINGSELKYTAYVSNEINRQVSSIVYFELLDCNNVSMLNWKSNTKGQIVSGSIIIPESILNGVYYLIAYTNKIRNYPFSALQYTPVVVQRIYEEPVDSICIANTGYASDSVSIKANKNNYLNIDIVENDSYSIVLKPQPNLEIAKLSVSVTEISPAQNNSYTKTFKSFSENTNKVFIKKPIKAEPMENNFSILSGKILNLKDSTPYANKTVYLAYPDSSIHFKYFITNTVGEFCFLLDSSFNNKVLYLQTNCNDSLKWTIDDKTILNSQIPTATNTHTNFGQKDYITLLQKREVVHRVYHDNPFYKSKTPSFSQTNFFHSPKNVVKPSDYIELTNFQDICDNILPSVRYKVVDNKVQIGMVIDQSIVFNNVLLSVNGLPCFNTDYISGLTSKDIKKIEVFNSVIMHGNLTFNGAIAIYTYKKEIDKKALVKSYHYINNDFYSGIIPETTKKDKSLPVVTPDVYWNPNLKISDNKTITVFFNKPEIGSNYIVTINGLVNNTIPFGYKKTIKLNN